MPNTRQALAAALAKAQIQLVNPEKSLVATIREEGRHGREQTFRYVPPFQWARDRARKYWASTKLRRCNLRVLIKPLVSSILQRCSRMHRGNGLPPEARLPHQ